MDAPYENLSEINLISNGNTQISKNYSSLNIELGKEITTNFIVFKFSEPTIKSYSLILKKFFNFHKPLFPQNISNEQIRDYLIYLVEERKLSASGQNQVINALKFYYEKVLNRSIPQLFLPRPRKSYY